MQRSIETSPAFPGPTEFLLQLHACAFPVFPTPPSRLLVVFTHRKLIVILSFLPYVRSLSAIRPHPASSMIPPQRMKNITQETVKEMRLCGRVWVHLPLSTGQRDINKSSGVLQALLGATLGGLLLLLRLDLGGLRLDFSRTGKGSVNFTHDV